MPCWSTAATSPCHIYDGSASPANLLDTVRIDQTQAPIGISNGSATFQELGDIYPQSGTLTVVLNAKSANGTAVADAVGINQAWATAGGQSQYETEPSYQQGVQDTGFRTTPDVLFDGSSSSGVTCVEDGGAGYDYYGTGLSSPCFAGLIAKLNARRRFPTVTFSIA